MALIGITFENQSVLPAYDGIANRLRITDGLMGDDRITVNGTNIFISTGLGVACGRMFRVTALETVATAPTYPDGYARIKCVVDLSGVSSISEFTQVSFGVDYSETDSFPALVQEDINNGGSTYESEFAVVKYTGGAISEIVRVKEATSTSVAGIVVPNGTDLSTLEVAAGTLVFERR